MQQKTSGLPFGDIIEKQPVAVIIHTAHNTIVGEIYIRPMMRIIDEINRAEKFLAVTNAVICDLSGSAGVQANFAAVNREHIISIVPKHEILVQRIQAGANRDGVIQAFSPREAVSFLADLPAQLG